MRKKFSAVVLALLVHSGALAQMPDWIMVRDGDGNRYYADPNGKIYTSGKPEFDYRAVSESGIAFYFNQGVELVKGGYKFEGLTLLKSILAMPAGGGKTSDYRSKASSEINRLIKKEGDRYAELDQNASILLYRQEGAVVLVNDLMRYRLEFPGEATVLRRRMREYGQYRYYGLLAGVRFSGSTAGPDASAYDVLIAIDSERFPSKISNMTALKKNWAKNLGADSFRRTPLRAGEREDLSRFDDGTAYGGYEAFYLRGRYGYCVRIISAGSERARNEALMEKVMQSFRLSFSD
ncbi:MAG TPA: hypothetical protein VLM75_13555 [Spirochaetota bacterium]|nr:hypothetical protein [Spirochaetota bacterium]